MSRLIKKTNFSIVSNAVIVDERVSFKDKGIYAYLCSRCDGWSFFLKEIASNSNDGVDAVRSGLKELEQGGYLIRHMTNSPESGKFEYDYEIFETPNATSPHSEKPHTVNPNAGFPVTEKDPCLLRTDLELRTNSINTDVHIACTHVSSVESIALKWESLMGKQVKIDSALTRVVNSKLKEYGVEDVIRTIELYSWAIYSKDSWITHKVSMFDFFQNDSKDISFVKFFHHTKETLTVTQKKESGGRNGNFMDNFKGGK